MKIKDITFSEKFMDDYSQAPDNIQSQFNTKMKNCADLRRVPPSVQAHKVEGEPNLWIGYVNPAWRFLFSMTVSGTMIVDCLLHHDAMDKYLRKLMS